MPKKELGVTADIETYLETVPPCNCGQSDCLTCLAQELQRDYPSNQIRTGVFQMSTDAANLQEIAAKFVHGQNYLSAWNRSADIRDEFAGDFESWCYFQSAYEQGSVRMLGGKEGR